MTQTSPAVLFKITTRSSPAASACAFAFAFLRGGDGDRVNCDAYTNCFSHVSRWVVVPMNYNSTGPLLATLPLFCIKRLSCAGTGGDDVDCSLNPTGDCSINVTAYAFMWQDRKSFLTTDANWNPPRTRSCDTPCCPHFHARVELSSGA
jgi:hypothetical protein